MRFANMLAIGMLASFSLATQALAAPVSVQFKNGSKWTIDHIYLSGAGEDNWGPDQLGDADGDVIEPGAAFTLTSIEPDKYDLKLVDEDGDACVVSGIKLGEDQVVNITDQNLLNCQNETDQEEESEE